MTNQIIWHCFPNESPERRIDRLNETLHRIFFDGKDVCPRGFLLEDDEGCTTCSLCGACSREIPYHKTPRFLESLDAMQLIVESGKFAEVREEFFHWLVRDGKLSYECRIMLYRSSEGEIWFQEAGKTRQEAFYLAALASQGYEVIKEEQGNQ
jgi:hypothetical protein